MAEAVKTLEGGKKKEGIGEFVQKTREELDRTTFPSSDDVKNTTLIVIINVIFFAIYLFAIDNAWKYLLDGLTWMVNRIAGY
jgi:preprotein translocase SecE subunit